MNRAFHPYLLLCLLICGVTAFADEQTTLPSASGSDAESRPDIPTELQEEDWLIAEGWGNADLTAGDWLADAGLPQVIGCRAPRVLGCNQVREGLQGELNSVLCYRIDVQPGTAHITIRTSGGTGDVDMYVRQGEPPTPTEFDSRPFVAGNEEETLIENPEPGPWYIALHGRTDYEGVTLSVRCSRPLDPRVRTEFQSASDLELAMYYELSGIALDTDPTLDEELRYQALREEGRLAFDTGDYERALEIWSRWQRLDPANPEPVSLIGDIYLRQDRLPEAIQQYQASLALRPSQINLMRRLSRLLDVEMEDPSAARDLLNFYGRLFPEDADVMLAKAEWLMRRQRFNEAYALIQTVIELNPQNLQPLSLLHGVLRTPQERFENMRRMLEMGGDAGRELILARAITDHQLLSRPESWILMPFIERMAYYSDIREVRTAFRNLLPRRDIAVEDFRVGRLSRHWISSQEEMWGEDGSLLLSADPSQTEAYLRLARSDAMHNGFVESTILYSTGFVWLYARRGEGNMIRYGFDGRGEMYQQIWLDGQLHAHDARLWSPPAEPATLRLEIRGDGVFAYLDGRPAFSSPLTIPQDMGLGWWGVAPWSPDPGDASVVMQSVSGGSLPVRIGMVDYDFSRGFADRNIEQLQHDLSGVSAVAPRWYAQRRTGKIDRLPFTQDQELRVLTRFARARLMPIVQSRSLYDLNWDQLLAVARQDRLDGFTIPVSRMPDTEWIRLAEAKASQANISVLLVLSEPCDATMLISEIAPMIGLFAGPRHMRRLPILDLRRSTDERPQDIDDKGDLILKL